MFSGSLKLSLVSTLALLTLGLDGRSTHAAFFQGLGDLPGGGFFSQAQSVSADGSTVVGYSSSAVPIIVVFNNVEGGLVTYSKGNLDFYSGGNDLTGDLTKLFSNELLSLPAPSGSFGSSEQQPFSPGRTHLKYRQN